MRNSHVSSAARARSANQRERKQGADGPTENWGGELLAFVRPTLSKQVRLQQTGRPT